MFKIACFLSFCFCIFSLFAENKSSIFVHDLSFIVEKLSYAQKVKLLEYQDQRRFKTNITLLEKQTLQLELQEVLQRFPIDRLTLNKLYKKINRIEQKLKTEKFQQFSFVLSILKRKQFNLVKDRIINRELSQN